MPPLTLGAGSIAGINAGAGLLGNILNAGATRRENTRQRQFTMDMYNAQRRDALADWHMQNDYNSPAAQMQRLKDAGLNPNLVYGSGSATQPAAQVRSSSGQGYNSKAPQVDTSFVGQSLMMFYEFARTQAETDRIKAQKELLEEQYWTEFSKRGLMDAKRNESHSKNALNLQQFDQKNQLFAPTLNKLLADTKRVTADTNRLLASTDFTISENQRKKELHQGNKEIQFQQLTNMRLDAALKQATTDEVRQRIINLKAQFNSISADVSWKQYKVYMQKEFGINIDSSSMLSDIQKFGNTVGKWLAELVN